MGIEMRLTPSDFSHGLMGYSVTGDHQLQCPAMVAQSLELVEEGYPEGGVLDHLQHHSRQQGTNSGGDRSEHHSSPHSTTFQCRVRHQKGMMRLYTFETSHAKSWKLIDSCFVNMTFRL